MSCYHPLVRMVKLDAAGMPVTNKNGEVQYYIRQYKEDDIGKLSELDARIPCGRCIGCKLDHSRQWADRMLMELQSARSGIFLTLTYNDENVPISSYMDNVGFEHKNYTLCKRDLQLFIKRLRKRYKDKRVRYYAAGEYGEMGLRPHYHAIIFGLSLEDIEAVEVLSPLGDIIKNKFGDIYYRSEIIEKLWNKGLVTVGNVTWKSCAYVARYVTKKWSSGYDSKGLRFKKEYYIENGIEWYTRENEDGSFSHYINDDGTKVVVQEVDLYKFFNVIPEFSIMSLKPGIGFEFMEQYLSNRQLILTDIKSIALSSGDEAKRVSVPKKIKQKYKDKAREFDLNLYDVYLEAQKRAAENAESRLILELSKTDLPMEDYFQVKERAHKKAAEMLVRDKI